MTLPKGLRGTDGQPAVPPYSNGPYTWDQVLNHSAVLNHLAKFGYGTGVGGEVTQATNRTTGVTLNKLTGTITTSSASLAAEATADFVVTNSTVAIGDVVVLSMQSGSNGGSTLINVSTVAAGSFTIRVHNGNGAAGTAETGAILINFAVIKATSS